MPSSILRRSFGERPEHVRIEKYTTSSTIRTAVLSRPCSTIPSNGSSSPQALPSAERRPALFVRWHPSADDQALGQGYYKGNWEPQA